MGWIIAAAILLLIFGLLACSVTVRFDYDKDGEITLRVSYLCFTVYSIPKKEKKVKKKRVRASKKSPSADNSAAEKEAGTEAAAEAAVHTDTEQAPTPPKADKKKKPAKAKKKLKLTLDDILALLRLATDSLIKPLKKLFKRIRIYDLCLYITCGGDDAAEAALNYGKTNVAVGAVLGNLDTFFSLKPYDVDIGVDFQSEESVSEFGCTLKLSVLAALAFAFTLIFRLLRHLKKHPQSERAVRKLAAMKK